MAKIVPFSSLPVYSKYPPSRHRDCGTWKVIVSNDETLIFNLATKKFVEIPTSTAVLDKLSCLVSSVATELPIANQCDTTKEVLKVSDMDRFFISATGVCYRLDSNNTLTGLTGTQIENFDTSKQNIDGGYLRPIDITVFSTVANALGITIRIVVSPAWANASIEWIRINDTQKVDLLGYMNELGLRVKYCGSGNMVFELMNANLSEIQKIHEFCTNRDIKVHQMHINIR